MFTSAIFTRKLTFVFAGTLFCAAVLATTNTSLADARARYRQDMADCNSGKSNLDRSTCRREAQSAFLEARRGGLNDDTSKYPENALLRCNLHKDADERAACEARMDGQGRVEGSVENGGILRVIETFKQEKQ